MGTTPNPRKIRGYRTRYSRAYETTKRSDYWKNVANITDFDVHVIMESNNEEFIQKQERRFIAHYGRRFLDKNGSLVNFNAGGEDNGRGLKKRRNVPIKQMDLNGNLIKVWSQPREIEEETKFLKTNVVKCCRKKQITAYGYKWEYLNNEEFKNIAPTTRRKKSLSRLD